MELDHILRREAADQLDAAALALYRAKSKLERTGEHRRSARCHDTLIMLRKWRDQLASEQGDISTAPDKEKRAISDFSA